MYKGCVALRKSGAFNIEIRNGVMKGVSWKLSTDFTDQTVIRINAGKITEAAFPPRH